MKLFKVFSVEETREIIKSNFSTELGSEKVPLVECTGRIVYNDILACTNVPDFRRSTVDGYAVFSKDVFGASESMPSMMSLKGEVLMGKEPPSSIDFPGECLYVPTGGMLPNGADCVVMIEYTDKLDDNTILINHSSAPGDNVIDIGEDISRGETVIEKGSILRPYEIGVLSSLGITEVLVFKKPRIAIVSTGDEVVAPGETPKPGEIRDINTYLLYSLIVESGGCPVDYGVIRDDYELLKKTVDRAVSECDIILISGGSSVGKKDQTMNVINSLGDPGVIVHGISVKPGKPSIIGKAGEKIVFGLPGHPLACAVIFKIIVKLYIDKLTCREDVQYPVICRFSINYHKAKGRDEYLPVTLEWKDGEIIAIPIFGKSGLITSFSKAWGYVKIDRNIEGLKEGQIVHAFRF